MIILLDRSKKPLGVSLGLIMVAICLTCKTIFILSKGPNIKPLVMTKALIDYNCFQKTETS